MTIDRRQQFRLVNCLDKMISDVWKNGLTPLDFFVRGRGPGQTELSATHFWPARARRFVRTKPG